MSVETRDGQVYQNITDLPETDEIQNGDYLIVETPTGTNILNYQNFLTDLDHTTFGTTITQNSTDIATLSAAQYTANQSLTANVQDNLNKFMTVGYSVSGTAVTTSFNGIAQELPVNFIQSNTIDGNFQNASSSLNGVASGSNAILLNPGSYQVTLYSNFSGGHVFLDLYNQTNSSVLLTSNYSSDPTLQGLITLDVRSTLKIRGYSNGTRYLALGLPFYVDGLVQTPLIATFQYLSSGAYPTVRPDVRS